MNQELNEMNNELDEILGQPETKEMQATSILQLFQTTKQERASFCQEVIDKLKDGAVDALNVHLQIKSLENIIEIFTDREKYPGTAIDYQRIILEAAEKHGKKFQYQNAVFSIKEVGSTYDFSKCDDPELLEMMQQQEVLKEQIKKKQDFLKTVPVSGMIVTNAQTGETYKCFPPAKSSTTSVAVSLK